MSLDGAGQVVREASHHPRRTSTITAAVRCLVLLQNAVFLRQSEAVAEVFIKLHPVRAFLLDAAYCFFSGARVYCGNGCRNYLVRKAAPRNLKQNRRIYG
jgi:hypothetical protein